MPFVILKARVVVDSTGSYQEMLVIVSPQGPVVTVIDYCLSTRRSYSWQKKLLRAAKLFFEYLETNAVPGEEEWRLFRNFSNKLIKGTIDSVSGTDPSGLYWEPVVAADANYMVAQLTELFDWLAREDAPRAGKFNPSFAGSNFDQRIAAAAYQFRCNKAFLGHNWRENSKSSGRVTQLDRQPKVFPENPPAFPEDRFEELLFKGFRVAGKYDYRGMLITLLEFGGGLRVSEPFHMFMQDVQPHWDDSSIAFVAIHHPTLGAAPKHWTDKHHNMKNRAQYLAARYGLTARNLMVGAHHAGWKDPALDEKWFMQVHWLPAETYGRLFMQIWQRYLEQVASIERNHPFAFINTERAVGGIYTIKQYNKALEAAVERIGLTFGKIWGTTPHGGRHA